MDGNPQLLEYIRQCQMRNPDNIIHREEDIQMGRTFDSCAAHLGKTEIPSL